MNFILVNGEANKGRVVYFMISSDEARKKTFDIIYAHQTEELRKIDKMIDEAIMRGEFRCSFEGTISATTKRELERCGYTVIMNSQYNEMVLDFIT